MMSSNSNNGSLVGGRFRLGKKLGDSSVPHIFDGTDTISGDMVVIKLETVNSEIPQIRWELHVYRSLIGEFGFPGVRWCGREFGYNVIVLDHLGPNLEDLYAFCYHKFSLKTVLTLAVDLLCRIACLHHKGFIHRDIQPANLVMGRGLFQNRVHIIDFRTAKRYGDFAGEDHSPQIRDVPIGTAIFASINAHLGIELSRRDDMETIGYVLLYLCREALPWENLEGETEEERDNLILDMKMRVGVEDLCRGLPPEFAIYMNYVRSLPLRARPDYFFLHKLFKDLFEREGFVWDYILSWHLIDR